MKVTRLGGTRPVLSIGSLIGGGSTPGATESPAPSGQVPTSSGSNGVSWGSNVATLTVNGTTLVRGPFINFANGSNTTVTVDQVGSAASNTIRIHAAGGAASFGSNATHVAEISSGGASSDSARMDHYHAGIGTITASSSNTLQRGMVNLRPGNNVSFGITDTDGDGELDTLTIHGAAAGGGSGSLTVADEGTPLSTAATTLDFVGAGVVASGTGATKTITIAGGSGGTSWTQVVGEDGSSFANFTSHGGGTWSSAGGKIEQTNTGGWFVARHNVATIAKGYPHILEAEMVVITGGGRAGMGFVDLAGTGGSGLNVQIIQGTGVRVDRHAASTIATITATINTSTTYKVRVIQGSTWLTVYLDSALIGNIELTGMSSTSDYFTLYSYGASVTFDNIKLWTLSGGAPA